MPLPSQTARTASIGRATMYRRKRSNLRPVAGAGAVVLVLGLGVWGIAKFALGGDGQPLSPQTAGATPPAAPKLLATDSPAAERPAERVAEAPPPAPLLELHQGRGPSNDPPETAPKLNPQPPEIAPRPDPTPANPPAAVPAQTISAPSDLQPALATARQKQLAGELVAARSLYSRVLADPRLSEGDRASLRAELTKINDDLVFSPKVAKDDPFTAIYAVQSNDNLIRISQRLGLGPDHRLLARINRLSNPDRLNLGQKLKVVKGPFHVIVHKSAYRLDLYMGPTERQDQWVYIRSFRVGLGSDGSTPVGEFIVKKGAKLINPPWINPRTGEQFAGADPKNPIGKHWIAIEGVGESSQYVGFGIHGTIEPDSIGQQRSMGCVRMLPDDIALMYELLGEVASTVKIQP